MGSTPARILVVDDYEPWRRLVVGTLREQPDLDVIAETSDGLEAIKKAEELRPDLILLDVGLPSLNGIEVARRINPGTNPTKIVFVTQNRSREIVEEALSAGAGGYVIKAEASADLLPAIRAVLAGGRFVSAALCGHVLVTTGVAGAQAYLSSLLMLIAGIG